MAHQAADGSKWTNASQARKVPGRAQGDGKQPVSSFSKPEPARAATAAPSSDSESPSTNSTTQDSQDPSAPQVEVTHDGNMFVVTAKFASEQEANAAAQSFSGSDQRGSGSSPQMNPAQAMM